MNKMHYPNPIKILIKWKNYKETCLLVISFSFSFFFSCKNMIQKTQGKFLNIQGDVLILTDFISLYRASKIFIQGTFCQWNLRTTNEASQCVTGPIRMPSLFPFCNGWGPRSWYVQQLCNLKFPWMVHVVETSILQ